MTDSHNVPPVARNVICVDFDGTLFEWGGLNDLHTRPFDGAVAFMHKLRVLGFKIVIFTSRMSPTWWLDECDNDTSKAAYFGKEQRAFVEAVLEKHKIPYDDITDEKVPAMYYIDDRAIQFKGNWKELMDLLLW